MLHCQIYKIVLTVTKYRAGWMGKSIIKSRIYATGKRLFS